MLENKQNKNILLLGDLIVLFQTKTPSNQVYMVSSTKKKIKIWLKPLRNLPVLIGNYNNSQKNEKIKFCVIHSLKGNLYLELS